MYSELPKEFFEAIGKIAVEFVLLERVIQEIISTSIGIDENLTQRLISTDSFEVLLSKFKQLLIYKLNVKKDKNDPVYVEIKELIKRLNDTNEKRNDILHSFWFLNNKKDAVLRHKYKRNNPVLSETINVEHDALIDLLSDITNCISELEDFERKFISNKPLNDYENDKKETGKKENS